MNVYRVSHLLISATYAPTAARLAKALEELLTVTKDQADEPDSPIFLAHAAARTAMYEYRKDTTK